MTGSTSAGDWLWTPLVAMITCALGAAALLLAQARVVPWLFAAHCDRTENCLASGVLLILFAGVSAVAALVAGGIVGVLRRRDSTPRTAAVRGLVVTGWCLVGYAVMSLVAWWPG